MDEVIYGITLGVLIVAKTHSSKNHITADIPLKKTFNAIIITVFISLRIIEFRSMNDEFIA